VLHEKGLAGGRIGIELGYLSARDYLDLAGRLPRAELVACERVFDELRLVKTPEEVAALTHAAHATERALLAAFRAIEVGHSEKKMVASLACNLLENGAEAINFLYINAGPNTGYPHCKGTTYAAQRGDIVKSDVGGFFQGYVSDVARTGVIGPPTAEQRSIYARLMQVHRATIESAHAGRTAADVFRAAQAAYQAADLPFPLPHAGHSVGLTAHEWPVLSPRHAVLHRVSRALDWARRVSRGGPRPHHRNGSSGDHRPL
jgi:Xaa-Pro aminopeptidase